MKIQHIKLGDTAKIASTRIVVIFHTYISKPHESILFIEHPDV